jgi:hypothetical protein
LFAEMNLRAVEVSRPTRVAVIAAGALTLVAGAAQAVQAGVSRAAGAHANVPVMQ